MDIDRNFNMKMTRGDSESITISCDEQPFAAGDEIRLTVRKSEFNPEKVLEKKVTEFEDGKAVIIIDPEDTADLYFRDYIYDIQLKHEGAITTIVTPSKFTIAQEVTYDE